MEDPAGRTVTFRLNFQERDDLLKKAINRETEIKGLLGPILKNFRAVGNLWAFGKSIQCNYTKKIP